MVDADGATDFTEITKIFKIVKAKTKNGLACVIGNRNHAGNQAQVKRKGIRKLLNTCMSMLVKFVLGFAYQDTQCGFKIFSRDAAKRIFPTQHLERWAFDIEVLYLCNSMDIPVVEVPVKWEDVDGSHLQIVDASFNIARDMLMVKALYSLGVWTN